jgi:hypothetical protein
VTAHTGSEDARLVCQRAVEIEIRFVDIHTKDPISTVVRWFAERDGDVLSSGSGIYEIGGGAEIRLPPGERFVLRCAAETYVNPEPRLIQVNSDAGSQKITIEFRPEQIAHATLTLVARDDAGRAVFPLMIGRMWSSSRHNSEEGRYVLQLPAGRHEIQLRSPSDQVLLYKREWIPSMHDPEDFAGARVWLPETVEVDLARGAHVTRHVTMQRGGLIWLRQQPKNAFADVRLVPDEFTPFLRFRHLYEGMGRVALVAPGRYRVEGRSRDKTVSATVEVTAEEVAEVWLRREPNGDD